MDNNGVCPGPNRPWQGGFLTGLLVLACSTHAQVVVTPPVESRAPTPAQLLRPDQPEVLAPPKAAQAAQSLDVARFKRAYAAAGRPKVALFWNRELTDRLALDKVELERGAAWESETRTPAQRERQAEWSTERRTLLEGQAAREAPAEEREWRMRSAYVNALLASGVQLLDRNLIMRSQALKTRDAAADPQRVETAAIRSGARWLLEVLLTPGADGSGVVIASRLKNVQDGSVMAETLYDGAAEAITAQTAAGKARRYAADPVRGGYQPVREPVLPGAQEQRMANAAAMALLASWVGAAPEARAAGR